VNFFPPTPCFVHRVDAKPPAFRDGTQFPSFLYSYKYRSTEPLLCWAGAKTPWQNFQSKHRGSTYGYQGVFTKCRYVPFTTPLLPLLSCLTFIKPALSPPHLLLELYHAGELHSTFAQPYLILFKFCLSTEAESKEKHGVWYPMQELTITSPYVHSRVDSFLRCMFFMFFSSFKARYIFSSL
jgi:hypothetical protein